MHHSFSLTKHFAKFRQGWTRPWSCSYPKISTKTPPSHVGEKMKTWELPDASSDVASAALLTPPAIKHGKMPPLSEVKCVRSEIKWNESLVRACRWDGRGCWVRFLQHPQMLPSWKWQEQVREWEKQRADHSFMQTALNAGVRSVSTCNNLSSFLTFFMLSRRQNHITGCKLLKSVDEQPGVRFIHVPLSCLTVRSSTAGHIPPSLFKLWQECERKTLSGTVDIKAAWRDPIDLEFRTGSLSTANRQKHRNTSQTWRTHRCPELSS